MIRLNYLFVDRLDDQMVRGGPLLVVRGVQYESMVGVRWERFPRLHISQIINYVNNIKISNASHESIYYLYITLQQQGGVIGRWGVAYLG